MRPPIIMVGFVFGLLLLLLGGVELYSYFTTGHFIPAPKTENEKTTRAISAVGKLMHLPNGELPTVATVNDLAPLAGQQFFVNAKVGDIILIYTDARKAILYDPVEKKIREVAPLSLEVNQ